MGTRADFYVGRGESAEWLGSIAWDGYPDGIDKAVLRAADEKGFREAAAAFFADREDVTLPERGWPWPWDDSATTDYAYAFDNGNTWVSCFGRQWFDARQPEPDVQDGLVVFPNMKDRKNVRWDRGSGVIVIGQPPE